jgi:hypothetical protein
LEDCEVDRLKKVFPNYKNGAVNLLRKLMIRSLALDQSKPSDALAGLNFSSAALHAIRLERRHDLAYHSQMDAIEDNTPRGWLNSLARGKAEIETGKTVPLEPFLDRLRASIARMKTRQNRPDLTEEA